MRHAGVYIILSKSTLESMFFCSFRTWHAFGSRHLAWKILVLNCLVTTAMGECDPKLYPDTASPSSYCSDRRNGWDRAGLWATGGCYPAGNSVGNDCSCSCVGRPENTVDPYCVSSIDNSWRYCFKSMASCENCPATQERIGCGCSQSTGSWQCSPGSCRTCLSGKYSDVSALNCKSCTLECPSHQFISSPCNSGQDITCSTCPAGHSCDKVNKRECEVNSYAAAGSGTCTACVSADAQVCLIQGLSAFEVGCTAGYSLSDGKCILTPPGYFTVNNLAQGGAVNFHKTYGNECPVGKFQENAGSTRCETCRPGTYASGVASVVCTGCKAGTFQDEWGGSGCVECSIGTYQISADSACALCRPGKFTDKRKSTKCSNCRGKGYNPMEGATQCMSCPEGKTTYVQIQENLFTEGQSAGSEAACNFCPSGFYTCECFSANSSAVELGSCFAENCTVGGIVHATCIPCPPNHFCPGDGKMYQRSEPLLGQTFIAAAPLFADNVVQDCTLCDFERGRMFVDFECTRDRNRECKRCREHSPMVTYVSQACLPHRDTVLADCVESEGHMRTTRECNPCPPGSRPVPGQTECERCPPNHFGGDGLVCQPCPEGTLSAAGSLHCSAQCGAGQFSKSGKLEDCLPMHSVGSTRTVADCEALQSSSAGVLIGKSTYLMASNGADSSFFWKLDSKDCYIIAKNSQSKISLMLEEQGSLGIFLAVESLAPQSLAVRRLQYEAGSVKELGKWESSSLGLNVRGLYEVSSSEFLVSDDVTHCIYRVARDLSQYELWAGSLAASAESLTSLWYPADLSAIPQYNSSIFVLDDRGIWKISSHAKNAPIEFWCCSSLVNQASMESKYMTSASSGVLLWAYAVDSAVEVLVIRGQNQFTTIKPIQYGNAQDTMLNGFASNRGVFVSVSSKEGEGTQIKEVGFDRCLCDEGYFCDASTQDQCVQIPAGFFVRAAWSNEIVPHAAGTLMGKRCPLSHFTTRTQGALNCEPICATGLYYDSRIDECVEGCDSSSGLYYDIESGACAQCPLGTYSTGQFGIVQGCLKCIPGKYGASPGVCQACPEGSVTVFYGSTECMPLTGKQSPQSLCKADGIYGSAETCRHKHSIGPAGMAFRFDSSIIGISATSSGSLYIVRDKKLLRYVGEQWNCKVSFSMDSSEDDASCATRVRASNQGLGMVQVADDEAVLYSAFPGSSCIFKIFMSGGLQNISEWVGSCGSYGDMNGDRLTGRLGAIFGLALLEGIEGKSSILFVSTQSSTIGSCMSIRSISVADGSITTLASFDQIQSPSIVLPYCLRDTSMRLAVVKGSDQIYYSMAHIIYAVKIFNFDVAKGELFPPDIFMNMELGQTITSVCAAPRNGFITVARNTDDTLHFQLPDAQMSLSVSSSGVISRPLNAIACAGQRIWYVSSDEAGSEIVREHSIIASNAEPQVFCAGGYAYSAESKICVQAGVGQYSSLEQNGMVRMCKPGTFGFKAGSASSIQCLKCPPGKISAEGAFACHACASASSMAIDGECVEKCPSGTFPSKEAMECVKCPPGHSSSSSASCFPCPPAFYANSSTGGLCVQCPEGWTSPLGAFKCVKKCKSNECGLDGEHCMPVKNKWEVMTGINVEGSMYIVSVVAARGNGIFFTDGNNIKYFLDTCSNVASAEEYEGCNITAVDLLPTICSNSRGVTVACDRGYIALAVTNEYADGFSSSMRYLYVASFKAHSIYRFPISYKVGRVDVEKTKAIIMENAAGLEYWRYIGTRRAGFRDGTFAEAQFNTISELELSSDDKLLIVSDFGNNRIRAADILKNQVTTILGRGAPCTRSGAVTSKTFDNVGGATLSSMCDGSDSEASIRGPLGIGLSSDKSKLFVAVNEESAVSSLDLSFIFESSAPPASIFDFECRLIYDRIANSVETCELSLNSKSCFLQRAYDVVSVGSALYASVRNGITKIDMDSKMCQQISGKAWDITLESEGYEDGVFDLTSGESEARFRQPYRIAVSPDNGIMYIADLQNKAIRRFFIDSMCQCPLGSKQIDGSFTCYDSTPKWSDNKLVDCPPGQFAFEGESTCRSCAEALDMGVTVNTCVIWHLNALRTGKIMYPYIRVLGNPFPFGMQSSDWYGVGGSSPAQWDSIFHDNSQVRYNLGKAEGRAPYGGDYVTYKFVEESGNWVIETDSSLQPKLLLPGFWYPCNVNPIIVTSDAGQALECSCPRILSSFEDMYSATSGTRKVSWHRLRLSAFEEGARALGTYTFAADKLELYAKSNSSYSLLEMDYADRIRMWSKYVIFGSDANAKNGVCRNVTRGPCFPVFKHVPDDQPLVPQEFRLGQSDKVTFSDEYGDMWLADAEDVGGELKCSVGWPAHYACPNGFVWVAPNSSELAGNARSKLPPWHAEQVACLSCMPGTFSFASDETKKFKGGPYRCDQCRLGTYASGVGSTACELCSIGFYSNVYGATACKRCPQSNYWTEARGAQSIHACKPCRPGTGKCDYCAAGEYQSMSAQDACLPCPPGQISTSVNSSQCTPCPPDHYQDRPGQAACERCPLNSFVSPDKTSCVTCVNGTCDLALNGICGNGCGLNYFWDIGERVCKRCGRGSLNAFHECAKESSACWNAPPWKIVTWDSLNRPGQDLIQDCQVGFQANADKTECVPCAEGFYGVENVGCVKCQPGYFSNSSAATSCSICEPGTFSGILGSTVCLNCERGSEAPGFAAVSCSQCGPGRYSSSTRSVKCELCSEGTYGKDVGRIADCDQLCDSDDGWFSGRGATACTFCSGGTVQGIECVGCGYGRYASTNPITGTPVCIECGLGLVNLNVTFGQLSDCVVCDSVTAYAPLNSGGITCTEAPLGSVPDPTRSAYVPCPRGTYRGEGQKQCVPCAPGTFAGEEGQAECSPCGEGRYAAASGSVACLRCRDNTVSRQIGSTSCESCPAGSISKNLSSSCMPCPPNFFQVDVNCFQCEEGTVAPQPGSTSCERCPDWTIYKIDTKTCGVCEPGHYMRPSVFVQGAFECAKCPPGTHNPNPGATNATESCRSCGPGLVPSWDSASCVTCGTGKYTPDGKVCEDCRPGFYSSDGVVCQPCPLGEYSDRFQTTVCSKCPSGYFGNGTGQTQCAECGVGTFAAHVGQTSCDICTSELGFSDARGSISCKPRRTSCDVGQYILVHYDKPWLDHQCVDCVPCKENQFVVTIDSERLNLIVEDSESASVGGEAVLCPGNLPFPSYRCIDNELIPGQYLASANLAGSSSSLYASIESLLQNVRPMSCSDLVEADRVLVDYVLGPTYNCYIGCKYGVVPETGISEYQKTFIVGVNEAPGSNIFYPRMASMADKVCRSCPLTPCQALGKYRPRVADNCGPPCGLSSYQAVCGSSEGCYGNCTALPEGAEFTGGSAILGDADACPWSCKLGWFTSDDLKVEKCVKCTSSSVCSEGFVMVPLNLCLPYHTKRDVCKACPFVEGGKAVGWNGATNLCIFECKKGYYSVNDRSSCAPCLPNSSSAFQPCEVGHYRDVDSCLSRGEEPVCKPCFRGDLDISFTSHGGTSQYNCSALCNAGLHTILKGSLPKVYISHSTPWRHSLSSLNITCEMCLPDDTVACHGKCPMKYFRNVSVALDTEQGACVRCKQSIDCGVGKYAVECSGNETADAACMICDQSKLFNSNGVQDRIYIPNQYVNDIFLRPQIQFMGSRVSDQCPSVCSVNFVQDLTNPAKCASCKDVMKSFSDYNARVQDPLQPSPADFVYSHWNATPAPIWWNPANTPKYLQRYIPAGAAGESQRAVSRRGICWACPLGRSTQAEDSDLCILLPGYTSPETLKYAVERIPIPVQGSDFRITFMREPRPLFLQAGLDLEAASLNQGGRRLLAVVNATSPQTTVALATVAMNSSVLVTCPHGWYKSEKGDGVCLACPSGTSTIARGSVSVLQCLCYPGWRRLGNLKLKNGACVPCPPNTYRPLYGVSEDTCLQCPENETTHGRSNATLCACKAGFLRRYGGDATCAACPAGSFCRPCFEGRGCPSTGVHVIPCFANSTSPPGSISIENCSCADRSLVKMSRRPQLSDSDITTTIIASGRSSSEFFYCLNLPPHAVFDEKNKRVTCKKGWIEVWSSSNILQGCVLCPMGQFAERDPSSESSLRVINGVVTDVGLVCLPCPRGTFGASRDLIGNCTPCPPTQTTQNAGASSLEQCSCPSSMTKRPGDGVCVGCLPHQYISQVTKKCTDCPPFSMITDATSSECTCSPGYTIPLIQAAGSGLKQKVSASGCVPCPKNTYSSHASNMPCKACPTGSMTSGVGARSVRECGATASLCVRGYTWKANFGCIPSGALI